MALPRGAGERWDYDCVQQMTLADLTIGGVNHRVLMQASKDGFFYVLDHENGKLLSASPFVRTTWASSVDMATGAAVEVKENLYSDTEAKMVSPTPFGATIGIRVLRSGRHISCISPRRRPDGPVRGRRTDYHAMAWNISQNPKAKRPPPSATVAIKGFTLAWDPVANKEAWRIPHDGPWNGGVLTTAGNLLIEGTEDHRRPRRPNTCDLHALIFAGNVLKERRTHCAWMESSAVVYCNSCVGARTSTEGKESTSAAMLTGVIPDWGFHRDESRLGSHLIEVDFEIESVMDWGMLGYFVGDAVQERIPVHVRAVLERRSLDSPQALWRGRGLLGRRGDVSHRRDNS